MDIGTLSFATGGTILDRHGGLGARLAAAAGEGAGGPDLHRVDDDGRRRAVSRMRSQPGATP